MYSNYETEGVLKITDNVVRCMRFCVLNKELWNTNKIAMIRAMGTEFPEFYEKFPRIVHAIGNCDNVLHLTNMLKILHEVEHKRLTMDEAHIKFNDLNNHAYGQKVMENLKEQTEQSGNV